MTAFCDGFRPILPEMWRCYIAFCERILDSDSKLKAERAKHDQAMRSLKANVGVLEPPAPSKWPSLGFGAKASGIGGIWQRMTMLG